MSHPPDDRPRRRPPADLAALRANLKALWWERRLVELDGQASARPNRPRTDGGSRADALVH